MVIGDGGANPGGIRTVVVGTVGKSQSTASIVESRLCGVPTFFVSVVDKDRTVDSVVVTLLVDIGLDLPKVRQELVKTPEVISRSRPPIKVVWNPTVERGGIDGT